MKKPPKRTDSIFIRNISKDIKDLFKAWCARRGVSMTRAIESYMKDRIKEDRDLQRD